MTERQMLNVVVCFCTIWGFVAGVVFAKLTA